MSDAKLKSLKVVDLKDILAKASVSVPAKANKQDLITRILASPAALEVYAKQQNPNAAPPPTAADDLLAPPEDFDWDGDETDAPKEPSKVTPAESTKPAKPSSKANVKPSSPKKSAPAAPEETAVPATPLAETTADEELEKRRKRAARFGVPLVEASILQAKKAPRSAAPPKPATPTPAGDNTEKLTARAARFGTGKAAEPVAGKKRPVEETVDAEELERRRKRAERFGTATSKV